MKGIQPPFPAPRPFPVQTLWLSFSFRSSYICISLSPLEHLLSQHVRGPCRDVLGCTSGSWSCLRQPAPRPLEHDPRHSSNLSFSPSLWLPRTATLSTQAACVRVWMEAGGHIVGYSLGHRPAWDNLVWRISACRARWFAVWRRRCSELLNIHPI